MIYCLRVLSNAFKRLPQEFFPIKSPFQKIISLKVGLLMLTKMCLPYNLLLYPMALEGII